MIAPFVGGGVGNKGVVHRYQMVAAMLSLKTGRPVRLATVARRSFSRAFSATAATLR